MKNYYQKRILMKKFTIVLILQSIFYSINISPSLPNKISYKQQEAEKISKEIDPLSVSNKDAQAYTILIQLKARTYDLYSAIQGSYAERCCVTRKLLCNAAIEKAQKTGMTDNPKIYAALQQTLIFAHGVIDEYYARRNNFSNISQRAKL